MSISKVLGLILFVFFIYVTLQDWSHGAKGVYEKIWLGEFQSEKRVDCEPIRPTVKDALDKQTADRANVKKVISEQK